MSQIEASIILLDNSEYARNGDLHQNRWQAQVDAANFLTSAKIQLNMENGVGFILSGGKQVSFIILNKIGPIIDDPNERSRNLHYQFIQAIIKRQFVQNFFSNIIPGTNHFSVAIYIAQLTLKHRINKKQKQRIIVFVASPIEEDVESLISLAKKLKKNNIAVDVVNFGEQNEEHLDKLQKFVDAVKKDKNGIFVNVKPGIGSVYDFVASEFVNQVDGADQGGQPAQGGVPGGAPVPGIGAAFQEFGGVDPNLDPELAMALKLSLEEEQQRQQQPQQQVQQPPQPVEEQKQQPVQKPDAIEEEKPVQSQLQQDEDEDEILKKAKNLSMEDQKQEDVFQDEDFVQGLLSSAIGEEVSKEELEKLLKKEKNKEERKDEKK